MSTVAESKAKLSQGLADLRVQADNLKVAAEREKKIASLRANSNHELKALQELKTAFEPEILRLAELDLTHIKNTGASVEALDDAPNIIVALDKAIGANESIVSGVVDAATLLDAPEQCETAAAIQERIEALVAGVVKLTLQPLKVTAST